MYGLYLHWPASIFACKCRHISYIFLHKNYIKFLWTCNRPLKSIFHFIASDLTITLNNKVSVSRTDCNSLGDIPFKSVQGREKCEIEIGGGGGQRKIQYTFKKNI